MRLSLLPLLVASCTGCISRTLDERAFFPSEDFQLLPEDLELEPQAFVVPVDGALLHAWRFLGDGGGDTVLVFGGNSSNKQLLLPLARSLVRHGYDAVLVDWRGFGLSTGEPRLKRLVPDAEAVLHYVRADPRTRGLAVTGVSLGSPVALAVATGAVDEVDAVILEGLLVPRHALREELGRVGAFFTGWLVIPGGFDVEENARELPLPLMFVHGSDDRMTPLEPAAEVFAASREARAPRTVWIADGAGHAPGIAGLYGSEYDELALDFLDVHLRGAGAPAEVELEWEVEGDTVRVAAHAQVAERTPVEFTLLQRTAGPVVVRTFLEKDGVLRITLPRAGEPIDVFARIPSGELQVLEDGSWSSPNPRRDAVLEAERLAEWTFKRLASDTEPAAACAEVGSELAAFSDRGVHPAAALRIADLWRALGLRYTELRDEPAARAAIERSLASLPSEPFAAWRFGDASWQLGLHAHELLATLKALSEIAPDEATRETDLARAELWRIAIEERAERVRSWTAAQRAERERLSVVAAGQYE